MSKELYQAWTASGTLYALIRNQSGEVYQTTTSTFVTWADADIANYAIAMVASGRVHFGDFPAVTAGVFDVFICLRAGGSPAITDAFISQGQIYWDGTAETTLYTVVENTDTLISNGGKINNISVQNETDVELTKARIYL